MRKRILVMLLVSLILITSFPMRTQATQSNYSVSLTSDSEGTLGVGDAVVVKVNIAGNNTSVTGYNAYDLKLSYDKQRLKIVSFIAADSHAEILHTDGRIWVKGYGAKKEFSTAAAVLTFKVLSPGTANVSITHAKIDINDNAGISDAPDAILADKTVNMSIDGFEVKVKGDVDAVYIDSYVAKNQVDYRFLLLDYKGYTYTVKVTIGGVDLTSKLIYDEEEGEYKIPKELIDGMIEITVTRGDPKAFVVTITGDDVSGEKTAVYKSNYVFKLDRDEKYLYRVQVTIGKAEYTGFTVKDDVYTIDGADIVGDIHIKVTKEMDYSGKVFIDFIGTGGKDGSGEKVADGGVEYPFKIKRKKGFTYSVAVYVNGKKITYEYDSELDTYYIPAEHVTGNITIVIGKVATVEVTEYVTLDEQSIYLIVYNGIVGEGQVPKYDGRSMYWSEKYNAYVWLVVSSETDKKAKKTAEEKITLNEGYAAGDIDYSGNVNRTLQIDLEDVRLIQEMYEGEHSLDFMEMKKLLSADIYADKKLNIRDAVAVVNGIYQEGESESK